MALKCLGLALLAATMAFSRGCEERPLPPASDETAPREQGADEPEDDEAQLGDSIQIRFAEDEYTFTLEEAAEGITIPYQIVVKRDVDLVIPYPQDIGQATLPGPSGLIPFEELFGGDQKYCIEDIGAGSGPPGYPSTIEEGVYGREFTWEGRNWTGPSDTMRPKGPPFPAGEYTLRVSCKGKRIFEDSSPEFMIESSVRVRLVE